MANIIHHGEKLSSTQIAALMAEATGWRPGDGDEIEGTVLGAKWGYSDVADRQYPIVFILLDEGTEYSNEDNEPNDIVAIHGLQTVLESELFSQRPQLGDRLYVKKVGAKGKAARKGWSPPTAFVVVTTKPSGKTADIWDQPVKGRRASTAPPDEEVPHPAEG